MAFKSSLLLMLSFFLGISGRQVIPSRFNFYNVDARSVNGSSAIGHCSNVSMNLYFTNCLLPDTSVLFDRNIPTLTGLDGDMWASQLLTLQATHFDSGTIGISFFFTDTMNYGGVTRVEVVMFFSQCSPPNYIYLSDIGNTAAGVFVMPTITSCDSLVKVCLEHDLSMNATWLFLQLNVGLNNWVHLAEVAFYDDTSTCPPDTIIRAPPPNTSTTPPPHTSIAPPPDTSTTPRPDTSTTPPPDTSTTDTSTTPPPDTSTTLPPDTSTTPPPDTNMTPPPDTSTTPPTSMNPPPDTTAHPPPDTTMLNPTTGSCHVSGTPAVMTAAIAAIATALLAMVIFVLVQIAVCKYHPKFKPGRGETRASARGGEGLYDEVSGNEGGVGNYYNHTYMTVGPGGESTIDFKRNEAYATTAIP